MMCDELLKRYPILFSKFSYFECHDGWYYLINDASFQIEQINRSFTNPDYKVTAHQIKDKFGSLRYYVECSDALIDDDLVYRQTLNKVDEIIRVAENRSNKTCKTCAGDLSFRNSARGHLEAFCEKCLK